VTGSDGLVAIARVLGPHGLDGRLKAEVLTEFPCRFLWTQTAVLLDGAGKRTPCVVQEARPHGRLLMLRLQGVGNRSQAARYVGCLLCVPEEETMPLPSGRFYPHQLVGARVEDIRRGTLGQVSAVWDGPAHPIIEVRSDQGTFLIPGVREMVRRLDVAGRRLLVELPQGLEEATRGG